MSRYWIDRDFLRPMYHPPPRRIRRGIIMPFEKPTTEALAHRFTYHPPKTDQKERYETIRSRIKETAEMCVRLTPVSPEQSRALNALDEAMFLFNAAIARNE